MIIVVIVTCIAIIMIIIIVFIIIVIVVVVVIITTLLRATKADLYGNNMYKSYVQQYLNSTITNNSCNNDFYHTISLFWSATCDIISVLF